MIILRREMEEIPWILTYTELQHSDLIFWNLERYFPVTKNKNKCLIFASFQKSEIGYIKSVTNIYLVYKLIKESY